MKKLLLTSTALLGAFGLNSAFAGEAPKMEIGGVVGVVMDLRTANSNDKSVGKSGDTATGHDISMPNYLNFLSFKGDGKTDAGLKYGAWLNILPGIDANNPGVKSDEASINFGGDWGLIRLGQDDSWTYDNAYRGSQVLAGFGSWGGPYDKNKIYTDFSFALVHAGFGDDDAKIMYSSPKFNGLSFGVNYIPNITNPADLSNTPSLKLGFGNQPGRVSTNYNSGIGGGLRYEYQIGDVKLGTSFNVESATADNKNFYNNKAYHLGQQAEFGNWKIATSYADYGKALTNKNPKEFVNVVGFNSAFKPLYDAGLFANNFETINAGYQTHLPRAFDLGISYKLTQISEYTKISLGFTRTNTQMKKGQLFEGVAQAAQKAVIGQAQIQAATTVATLGGNAAAQSAAATAVLTNPAVLAAAANQANLVRQAAGVQVKNAVENGFQFGFFTPLAEGVGTFAEYNVSIQDDGRNINNKLTEQSISIGAIIWF